MSNRLPVSKDPKSSASKPISPSSSSSSSSSKGTKKHAALRCNLKFTPQEYSNINRRITETVNIILPHDILVQGPGPEAYELHANLGVALVAEIIIRPIKRPCSLADPVLQEKIRAMANDPALPEFRHTYWGGKVWFFFRVLNIEQARKPLPDHDVGGSERVEQLGETW